MDERTETGKFKDFTLSQIKIIMALLDQALRNLGDLEKNIEKVQNVRLESEKLGPRS